MRRVTTFFHSNAHRSRIDCVLRPDRSPFTRDRTYRAFYYRSGDGIVLPERSSVRSNAPVVETKNDQASRGKRYQPKLWTETRPTTLRSFTPPVHEVFAGSKVEGRWNPFSPTDRAYQHVPETMMANPTEQIIFAHPKHTFNGKP